MNKKPSAKKPGSQPAKKPAAVKPRSRAKASKSGSAVSGAGLPAVLNDLHPDAANPRKISDEAKRALRASLRRFGDLSGITFNRTTGELVAGHQRIEQLRAEYGDEPRLEHAADGSASLTLGGNRFAVRIVEWSRAKQRAANVAANNQRMQGAFTDDLASFLLEVEAEATEEMPGVFDDLLLADMMGDGLLAEDEKKHAEARVPEAFQVIVECEDEKQQRELYERLCKDGRTCKLLTI
ncbi:hypothetical protein Pla175_17640 [Pirellulimonas nuda]|uniref:ParB/Sulfiredoxin domain-containing protein n=1 Tax=Pirellulimonas nuda TaxID=2528009 RepID=A0A518DAB1_9BACT|nr:hypothetical protein [Pirellulimonas nuda]QDU88388.1 hypothetical protein Pla175_17640 [Pirellulimonas nuda]